MMHCLPSLVLLATVAAYPAGEAPSQKVQVQLCETGLPGVNAWPVFASPKADDVYHTPHFAFSRLPHKYIDSGIRADRGKPLLVRASAKVAFPVGQHRLLMRGRGASRLFINHELVLKTPFPPALDDGSTGNDPNKFPYLNLSPQFRFAPPGNREAWCEFKSDGREVVLVLETLIGNYLNSKAFRRSELGETVLAVSLAGQAEFQLVGFGEVVPYTDAGWSKYATSQEDYLDKLDAERRAKAFSSEAKQWNSKRTATKHWLANTPAVPVPALPKGYTANNAIDHFLAEKRSTAPSGTAASQVNFASEVRTILEAKCFSCHQGAKPKGDLNLDQPNAAIVPGKPGESSLIQRITSQDEGELMPPKGGRLSPKEVKTLTDWIADGGHYAERPGPLTPLTDDLTFLRRVTLDTVGVVPNPVEIQAFLNDTSPEKRSRVIDKLLNDPRRADHWVSYWQDVLAENPNILNPTLNNTGPFRWWLHEAYQDHKPFDVMVTELVRLRGSVRGGGPAGFGIASENDVPLADKGIVVASAFLGVNMRCARCHDAPANKATQKELFQLAGLLVGKPISVPKTSSVPVDKLHTGGRPSLIKVTLQPGTTVKPAWPFDEFLKVGTAPNSLETRDKLAAWLTSPTNERFAQVTVNRLWKQLMGRGIVEPVDDWERGSPSHPELLKYLAREFVASGYDLRHVERLIFNSQAYQRAADPSRTTIDAYFSAPVKRRLSAEQIVDSLFAASGKPLNVGEINLDIDGSRDQGNSISLGVPRRAWEFASTSNERDRPSLALPRVQAVVDVLASFGWRASRPDPLTVRELSPDVLQPATLSNGVVATWVTRLSDDHAVTRLAVEAKSPEDFVEQLCLRVLTRKPTAPERERLVQHLRDGFETRLVDVPPVENKPIEKRTRPRYVSWSNHLMPYANDLKTQLEQQARDGDPPTNKLNTGWRLRAEDVLWTLLNAPEFVFTP